MKNRSSNIILLAASLYAITGCSKEASAQDNSESITDGDTHSEVTEKSSTRLKLLNESTQWLEFKKIWKKLDAIKPTSEDSDDFFGNYMHCMNYDEVEKYRRKISHTTEQLREVGEAVLTEDEIEILREVSLNRVEYLANGRTSMMTRMIVFDSRLTTEQSLVDIENQIDILISLQKNGTITGDEFDQALEILNGTIHRFSIISIITSNFGAQIGYPFYSTKDLSDQIEHHSSDSIFNQYVLEFESSYQLYKQRDDVDSSYDELEQKYETTRTEIQNLIEILPRFSELIYDLEVNQ